MPYKRNPMRCERICALSRYVVADMLNPAMTASTQWLERTLDDSANRRIAISEAFLAVDAILSVYLNVTSDLVVYPKVIEARVMAELPFIASENIMMDLVRRGGDRQEIHEKIRVHSIAAGKQVKEQGEKNDMLERIAADPSFNITMEELKDILIPSLYTGRSASQVDEFIAEYIDPAIGEAEKTTVGLAV
jgi:adenylosuccinate lyase